MAKAPGSFGRFLWIIPAVVGFGLLTWLSFFPAGRQMRPVTKKWLNWAWVFVGLAVLGLLTGGVGLLLVWPVGIIMFLVMLKSWNQFAASTMKPFPGFIDAPPPVINAAPPAAPVTTTSPPPAAPRPPRPTPAAASTRAPSVPTGSGDKTPVVFISHATEDRESTQVLADELESRGVQTWLAYRDVGVGSNYAEEIVNAIVGADYLLVVLSEAAIQSPHIRREVTIGIDRGIPLLPVNMSASEDFMWTLPVDWTYWLSLAQVLRHTDEASTASELARRITR